MADKFPALDDTAVSTAESSENVGDSDFLSREKELVGNEFETEQDKDVWAESDEDISEFKEQFPEVDNTAPVQPAQQLSFEKEEEEEKEPQPKVFQADSEPLKQWKERRDLEISEREEVNSRKKKDIISKARQTVDDFYDNYNSNKEQQSKEVLKEQEAFVEKRDQFLKRGTLWDRVNELVTEVGEVSTSEDRDKTRFKRLLKSLKGKENVPGAGGY
ncbi:uncharacterized protein PRCAT00003652001 [Priceomyces carsonii]|uniref:uncharacterized protein n=1 Tax=Priceomyces carsonii TaxID=28549 RepID=UPI002EDB5298|nr:unnamed protein product [Priceomyces carsonii]